MDKLLNNNRSMEEMFSYFLYILMILLSVFVCIIYLEAEVGSKFTPELLIGISALTASLAMSRSVYATKVSDNIKENRELFKDRLNVHTDTSRFVFKVLSVQVSEQHLEDFYTIRLRAKIYFPQDKNIHLLLEKIVTLARKLHDPKQHSVNFKGLTDKEVLEKMFDIKEQITQNSHALENLYFTYLKI